MSETRVLYRIKPVDKKSLELFYDVFRKEGDKVIDWSVTELYRWGQGFVEDEDDLPFSDDSYIHVNPNIGDGCELEDSCSIDFQYGDNVSQEEREEIERLYCEGDEDGRAYAAWLFDGDHDWELEDEHLLIYGPFEVDKLTYSDYTLISEERIELKPRPKHVKSDAWPFE